MEQLLAHLIGDYCVQSEWMAQNKSRKTFPCLVHASLYTACFWLLTSSWTALAIIGVTHFFIDRYRLVRFVIYAKNFLTPEATAVPWEYCDTTGLYDHIPDNALSREVASILEKDHNLKPNPVWLSTWLAIVTDNTIHLLINFLTLSYFAHA
jgi:hypothetical protein